MKRIMTVLLALLLCAAMLLPALAEGEVSITLSESSLLIGTGVKMKLEAATESTEKLKYTWESSNKKIASVDAKGTVSGVAAGEATITCTAMLGKNAVATASCEVTVYTSVKSVKAASPIKGNLLFVNLPVQIETTIAPKDAAYTKLRWTSSDESVATVDENGVVTAHQPGKVKITCETDQPNQTKALTASVQFTVKQGVEKIELDAEMLILWEKDTTQDAADTAEISLEVLPENAENRKVKWDTSDKNVATVKNGTVTVVKAGVCTVTATAADGGGTAASCKVFVLGSFTYKFNASTLKDAGVVFTADAEKATETAGRIVLSAQERLAETENVSRAEILNYFAQTAAANGKIYLTGSADNEAFPVTVVMVSDEDNCAMLTYDPVWGSFYFSTARHFTDNNFPQATVDNAAFGAMLLAPAAEGE